MASRGKSAGKVDRYRGLGVDSLVIDSMNYNVHETDDPREAASYSGFNLGVNYHWSGDIVIPLVYRLGAVDSFNFTRVSFDCRRETLFHEICHRLASNHSIRVIDDEIDEESLCNWFAYAVCLVFSQNPCLKDLF